MKRPFRTRLAALAAALLLLLSGAGDVLGAHPCAHHDGLEAPHPAAPEAEHAAHAHAHHAGHDAPAEGEPHGGCTCVGTCAAPGAAQVPAAPEAAVASESALPRRTALPAPGALPARLGSYLLPYGTAPPHA